MHYILLTKKELAKANLIQLQQQLTAQQNNPPIPIPLRGDFEWFGMNGRAVEEEKPSYAYEFKEELLRLQEEALEKGLSLPPSFLLFMSNKRMLHRIYSRTDCYFELPEVIEEIAPNSGIYLLRFYSDSQYSCFWYVCLDQQGNSCVLYSQDLYGYATEEPGFEKKDVLEYATPTFEAFIFRYWIETSIACKEGNGLTAWEQAYVARKKE